MSTMTRARFPAWLRQQHARQDPVGDLARDMRRDHAWPPSATTLRAFERHLKCMGACDGAVNALQRAFTEWQSGAAGATS